MADFGFVPDQQQAQDFGFVPDAPAQAPAAPPASSDAYMPTSILSPQEEKQSTVDFTQQHPFIAGLASSPAGMVPHSWDDVKQMMTLPSPSSGVIGPKDEQWGAAIRGEYGPEAQGQTVGSTALQALPLLHLPFAESPFRAGPADLAMVHEMRPPASGSDAAGKILMDTGLLGTGAGEAADAAVRETMAPQAPEAPVKAPSAPSGASEAAPRVEGAPPQPEAANVPLQPEPAAATVRPPNEFQTSEAEAGQRDTAPAEPAPVGEPDQPQAGTRTGQAAGTSNRQNVETYGEDAVPSGTGVDTGELLDNARAAIRTGAVDPYSVLSKTSQKGIANPEEYAALAAEHERLVNEAVAKQKAGAPDAEQASQAANDFANAIQPHKTAASDLFRLMQGDLNYDMSTPFGIDQYMKAELGRGMKASERPMFEQHATGIRNAETGVADAVNRSDAKVQGRYRNVRDIPMEEAAARVREFLKPCQV